MGLSENLVEIKSEVEALTTYANETTGQSDTTLSDAVASLIAGYGGGGATVVNGEVVSTSTAYALYIPEIQTIPDIFIFELDTSTTSGFTSGLCYGGFRQKTGIYGMDIKSTTTAYYGAAGTVYTAMNILIQYNQLTINVTPKTYIGTYKYTAIWL